MAIPFGAFATHFSDATPPPAAIRRVKRWAAVAGALIFVLPIAAIAVTRSIPKAHKDILLRLEFAATPEAVRAATPADAQLAVVRAQRDDSQFLIPAYWAVFTTIGIVLWVSGGRVNRVCGVAIAAGIAVAAVCDWRENVLIIAALAGEPASASPAPWALAKWNLLFVVALILAVPLATRSQHLRIHANLTAVLFAIAAVRGLWGTGFNHAAIPEATVILAIAIFLLALLFIWDAEFFSKDSDSPAAGN